MIEKACTAHLRRALLLAGPQVLLLKLLVSDLWEVAGVLQRDGQQGAPQSGPARSSAAGPQLAALQASSLSGSARPRLAPLTRLGAATGSTAVRVCRKDAGGGAFVSSCAIAGVFLYVCCSPCTNPVYLGRRGEGFKRHSRLEVRGGRPAGRGMRSALLSRRAARGLWRPAG